MKTARFETPLIEGHRGVTVVLVPFNPEAVWRQSPVRLAGRRYGWLIRGTANGVRFNGYIGERWGRYFIAIDEALRCAARASVGQIVSLIVEPTNTAKAYRHACEQSKSTTQPSKARTDALSFGDSG
jgi:hypothetical protein